MKALFIGQGNIGSTSRTRFGLLQEIINSKIELLDISFTIDSTHRLARSIGWRYYIGPLVNKINKQIDEYLLCEQTRFDFIWIDKGVFIFPQLLYELKLRTPILIHYTPDTAFFENNSRHFRKGMYLYDLLVTTKSFEFNEYKKRVDQEKVCLISQGYNPSLGLKQCAFEQKEKAITFIGLCERYRAQIISFLLKNGFKVYLGGMGWRSFVKEFNHDDNLVFIGEKIWDEEYSLAMSKSMFGLGLLSKKFPELHTTRTFEIPACGTCLVTERNSEIDTFFKDDEAIKFANCNELLHKLNVYSNNLVDLKKITINGIIRNENGGRDYRNQLKNVLIQANVIDSF